MHLGFTFAVLIVLSNIGVGVGAIVLAAIVYYVERRRGKVRTKWVAAAALLPFIATAYMWAGFFAYVGWCDVRGVDAGVFDDNKRIPLGDGYSLEIIPPYRQQYLMTPGIGVSHKGLKRIGSNEKLIVGEDAQGFFLLDVERHRAHRMRSATEVQLKLSSEGMTQIELLTPDEFYDRRRWGALDAMAATVILVPPFAALCLFGWRLAQAG